MQGNRRSGVGGTALLGLLLLLAANVALVGSHAMKGRQRFAREVVVEDESTLRLAVVVHRHGDRTPVIVPEGHEDRWPTGPGQLTGLGVHQLWELGEHLRESLSEEFLATSYAPELVYSRASNKDRTLQSAEAMLVRLPSLSLCAHVPQLLPLPPWPSLRPSLALAVLFPSSLSLSPHSPPLLLYLMCSPSYGEEERQ